MTSAERISELLRNGEGLGVEFKRCSGTVEHDVFETICAFLNRFGGDVLLGVEDDGTVVGVKGDAAALRNNLVNVANDPRVFDPVFYLDPKIVAYDGRTLVHVRVPASAEMHAYKGVVFDRNGDADVRVRSVAAKGLMLLRKQRIFTERHVYPYVAKADLDLSDLPRLRIRAQNNVRDGRRHPWMDMDDDQLLRSARLVGTDRETGKTGFNLAAVMLFGTQDVIKDVCPAYVTDALLRRVNVDRYDDRDIVDVNLIAAYDRLMDFARKHLPDPFYLERDVRVSLREVIVREMVSNVLIHREFTSSRPARLVIERDRMFVENACRASNGEVVTPDTLEPDPKNPIIAAFFREIAYADQLGSGVKNLYRYAKAYGGADPTFQDGDVFRISVSLDKLKRLSGAEIGTDLEFGTEPAEVGSVSGELGAVSAEVGAVQGKDGTPDREKMAVPDEKWDARLAGYRSDLIRTVRKVLSAIASDPTVSIRGLAERLNVAVSTVQNSLKVLKETGLLERKGETSARTWIINWNDSVFKENGVQGAGGAQGLCVEGPSH